MDGPSVAEVKKDVEFEVKLNFPDSAVSVSCNG